MLAHIPELLSPEDLGSIDGLLNAGDYRDGKRTAHGKAKEVKNNLEFEYVQGRRSDIQLAEMVTKALERSREFQEVAKPRVILPPIFNRYDEGMYYGMHTDAPTMHKGKFRCDLSVTVFLVEPTSYDGGELVFDTGHGEVTAKHARGDAIVYPTTVLHRVETVRRGSRICAITWVQSHVREEWKRRILYDMRKAHALMSRLDPDAPELMRYRNSMMNLEREWWET